MIKWQDWAILAINSVRYSSTHLPAAVVPPAPFGSTTSSWSSPSLPHQAPELALRGLLYYTSSAYNAASEDRWRTGGEAQIKAFVGINNKPVICTDHQAKPTPDLRQAESQITSAV